MECFYNWLELFLTDAENLIYPQNTLCIGLVYVALGMDLQQFTDENLIEMRNSSRFLLCTNPFNSFFLAYLKEFGIEIHEILGSVQYVSGILTLIRVIHHV